MTVVGLVTDGAVARRGTVASPHIKWQTKSDRLARFRAPVFGKEEVTVDADVAVVGIGSMGSMAAWRLAAAGVDVVAIDQFGIGDRRTAAAGESRGLVRALHPRPEFMPLVDRALDLWRQLESESGRSLYLPTGTLLIGKRRSQRFQRLLATIDDGAPGLEVLDHAELAARYPAHVVGPEDVAVFESIGGVLRSDLAVIAAAQRASALGAEFVTGHPVNRIESRDSVVTIEVGGRTLRVRKAVVTPGAWAGRLLPQLSGVIAAQRIVIAWYAAQEPELFTPARFPLFMRGDGEAPGSSNFLADDYFGTPSLDNYSVKFARLDTCGPVSPTDRLDQYVEPELIDADAARLARYVRGVHPHPLRTLVAMDGFTPDGFPLIGPVPGHQNVLVGAGFSGSGFKYSAAVGDLLAGMALGKPARLSLETFSPDRFAPSDLPVL